MIKKTLILLIAFAFIFANIGIIHSQTPAPVFDYNRAYADYVYNTDLYNTAYSDYQVARSAYLSSKTLAAQTNAQSATLKMLQARDEMVKTYLTALRMRIKETQGLVDNDKNVIFSQIDTDVAWWIAHKTKLTSAATLDDLVADSNEAYDHYPSTLIVIYNGLFDVFTGRIDDNRNNMQRIVESIKVEVAQIKANGDKNTSQIERTLIDVDNDVQRSQTKESEAKNIITGMTLEQNASESNDQKFENAKTKLKESLAYLNDAEKLIIQIMTQIKTKD
ncbi:MAG TPA: hypothetical protein VF185_00285 [Patescibacteria group bacterium]